VHDGWHVVNELDETEQVQASYIRGHEWLTQLDDQGDGAYYVNNIHSDVTHLTGQQGQILNAHTYDAFGNMQSTREERSKPFLIYGRNARRQVSFCLQKFYITECQHFNKEYTKFYVVMT